MLLWFVAIVGAVDFSMFWLLLAVLIPFALIFYTIGWRRLNKHSGNLVVRSKKH